MMAPLAGTVEVTAGGGAVVKVHTVLARAVPDIFFAPLEIVAVYKVEVAKAVPGVKVAVFPTYMTPPATAVVPGPASLKVVVLIVLAFIGTSKVPLTVAF
jgi:hypothetical protein